MSDLPSTPSHEGARPPVDPDGQRRHGRPPSWLWRAPVADPVDRRNAPMLQVVLLLLGSLPPLLWLYRVLLSGIPWRAGETASMLMSLSVSAFALFGVALIRFGRFQWAIRQTLALVALVMILSHALEGSSRQGYEQPLAVVWMVLAGLMVGRRALWAMYACVIASSIAGGLVDLRAGHPIDTGMNVTASIVIDAVIFLLIAVVIDRSVRALRESLSDATRRGDALAQANRRLEAEMAEREKVQQQLIHAQKVEAVGRLASGVAHDFNHLLSLILGYAAKGRQLEDVDELKKALGGVEAAGRRATAVTQKLLTFGRSEATQLERFDLIEALHDLQPMLRQLFDPGVRIVYAPAPQPLPIEFDRAQFDLVVLGIAANANDAMPDGGRFELQARNLDDGARVELSLRDSGHGIDPAVRPRLFEAFFTTKPAGRGSGLGLAVAQDLVAAAGGRIEVDSEPGAGATFRIVLPAAQPEYADA